jgi:hypothetical protein
MWRSSIELGRASTEVGVNEFVKMLYLNIDTLNQLLTLISLL